MQLLMDVRPAVSSCWVSEVVVQVQDYSLAFLSASAREDRQSYASDLFYGLGTWFVAARKLSCRALGEFQDQRLLASLTHSKIALRNL